MQTIGLTGIDALEAEMRDRLAAKNAEIERLANQVKAYSEGCDRHEAEIERLERGIGEFVENALKDSMERQSLLARIKEQDELLAKVLADNERLNSAAAFHDAWKADAT